MLLLWFTLLFFPCLLTNGLIRYKNSSLKVKGMGLANYDLYNSGYLPTINFPSKFNFNITSLNKSPIWFNGIVLGHNLTIKLLLSAKIKFCRFWLYLQKCYHKNKESCSLIGQMHGHAHFKPLCQYVDFMHVYQHAKNQIHTSIGFWDMWDSRICNLISWENYSMTGTISQNLLQKLNHLVIFWTIIQESDFSHAFSFCRIIKKTIENHLKLRKYTWEKNME